MLNGQYDRAIASYEKVLEIAPDNEDAAAQLRQIAYLQNKD